MSKRKKIIIMSSLVFLLALTAVLNVLLAQNRTTASGETFVTTSNYFTAYRSERTATRSEELLQLDSIIALYEEGSEKYNEAVNLKLKIVEMMEKELLLETMIKSRGYSDAIVSIGMDSDNVNVFISSNELSLNNWLTIYTFLRDEAGINEENIIILPVYSQA